MHMNFSEISLGNRYFFDRRLSRALDDVVEGHFVT
ncbi:hypothetical protein ACVWZK_000229 [Bradyrhizobium sp. GM0.4]